MNVIEKQGKLDMAVYVIYRKEDSFSWSLEIRIQVPSLLLGGLQLCFQELLEGVIAGLLGKQNDGLQRCPCANSWTYECITLYGKRNLADMVKVRTLREGYYPG